MTLDLILMISLCIRGTYTIKNSPGFSDQNTVIASFLVSERNETKEEPTNYFYSDIPLYNLEELEEEK